MDTYGFSGGRCPMGVRSIGRARLVEAGSRSASSLNLISLSWGLRDTTRTTARERFKCSPAFSGTSCGGFRLRVELEARGAGRIGPLMAHMLRSPRCNDPVCFLGAFCHVDNVAGRLTRDPKAKLSTSF